MVLKRKRMRDEALRKPYILIMHVAKKYQDFYTLINFVYKKIDN